MAVTPEMQPGDVVLFNPLVIHGSVGNRSTALCRVYINGYGRGSACRHGMPVLVHGCPTDEIAGTMEHEAERYSLSHAARY